MNEMQTLKTKVEKAVGAFIEHLDSRDKVLNEIKTDLSLLIESFKSALTKDDKAEIIAEIDRAAISFRTEVDSLAPRVKDLEVKVWPKGKPASA